MRKTLSLVCCLFLVAALASCGTSAGSDDEGASGSTTAAPGDDEATTTEADDDTTTTEGGDDTTTTEAGGDADAQPYVDALVTSMSTGDPTENLVITADEAGCVAPVWIDTIGLDALADVDPEDLADPALDLEGIVDVDEEQAATMIAAYGDCGVDIEQEFIDYITSDLTEDQQGCVADALADVDLTDLLEGALVDSDAAEAEYRDQLQGPFTTCGVN